MADNRPLFDDSNMVVPVRLVCRNRVLSDMGRFYFCMVLCGVYVLGFFQQEETPCLT